MPSGAPGQAAPLPLQSKQSLGVPAIAPAEKRPWDLIRVMPAWESEAISLVDIFQFCWAALAWMTTIAVLWPVNAPMAALAFRIWRETKETDIEGSELWTRAFLASAALAVLVIGFVLLDWLLADMAEFPPGPIHLVIFAGFVALAAWLMQYLFSLEDYFQGLSLVVIYLFLPL